MQMPDGDEDRTRPVPTPSPSSMNRAAVEPASGGVSLGRIGSLEVRLAERENDVRRAQRLRFEVFYGEQSARATLGERLGRRDEDRYDSLCDHLLVLDHATEAGLFGTAKAQIVGTCRLLRREVAERGPGFYTAGEYEIGSLLAARPDLRFLELGRSCVRQSHRDKRTAELLWHGIWAYVLRHGIDVMFGCASFEGADPQAHALPLSFLHHHVLSPKGWRVRAVAERYVDMNLMPKDAIDVKAALRTLPPLIKGYLRLGATFGDGAVIDFQFGTTDVLVMLPVATISTRYIGYYGADAGRHSA